MNVAVDLMKRGAIAALVSFALFSLLPGAAGAQASPKPSYEVSGPYGHRNLAIYLVRDPKANAVKAKGLITLDEAISKGYVTVRETGDVNELEIENKSDYKVYVQAGDIVKGGQQDRTFQDDMVLQPRSGKVPVASYCVEHGRWSKRGNEEVKVFGSAKKQLASSELKLAARKGKDQGAVWAQVAATQEKLNDNLGAEVRSASSSTSLQLTLENEDLAKLGKEYRDAVTKKAGKIDGAVGVAIAINGKMVSADVYGDPDLFARLWPRILEAAATEAIAKAEGKGEKLGPSAAAAKEWMLKAERAAAKAEDVDKKNGVRVRENEEAISFESYEKDDAGGFVHRAYIGK